MHGAGTPQHGGVAPHSDRLRTSHKGKQKQAWKPGLVTEYQSVRSPSSTSPAIGLRTSKCTVMYAAVQWDARGQGGEAVYLSFHPNRAEEDEQWDEAEKTPGTQQAQVRQHAKASKPRKNKMGPRAMTMMHHP